MKVILHLYTQMNTADFCIWVKNGNTQLVPVMRLQRKSLIRVLVGIGFNFAAVEILRLMFCDFERELMGQKNWMRVLHLNMSNPQQQCPVPNNNFRLITEDGLRLCGRGSGPGCKSVYAYANNFAFRRVCGHITAFRYHTTDGFFRHGCPSCTIEGPYVDGISITYGNWNSRKHVWSFAMYCAGSAGTPPNFVGDNYYCETPSHHAHNNLYSHDPLFAGRWFCVELPQPTTESLEVRLCGDQTLEDEDAMIQFVELYVQ